MSPVTFAMERMPRTRYTCGPPVSSPASSRVRKRTPRKHSAYFEAMPSSAVVHIQNRAPGPPIQIAVATPTMLPVPTVTASAVAIAW